jgi:hypothetical protein
MPSENPRDPFRDPFRELEPDEPSESREGRRMVRDALIWVSLLLLAMVVIATCSSCVRHATRRTPAEQAGRAVVVAQACRIQSNPPLWGVYRSSGVRIDAEHVLTAWHSVNCYNDKGRPEPVFIADPKATRAFRVEGPTLVFDAAAGAVEATIERADVEHDVVRLRVPRDSRFARPVRPADVGSHDAVCAETAWPTPGRRCGRVTAVVDWGFVTGFDVVPGNSGSAVYDAFGRIVGIIVRQGGQAAPVSRWLVP